MRNFLYITLFVALAFSSFNSLAQTVTSQPPVLSFHKRPAQPIIQLRPFQSCFTRVTVLEHPSAFGSFVHYPAFFCQMEQKSVNRLGVMVQVHAGDYNSYNRRR